MNWDAITAISSVLSMIAFFATAIYIRSQLKQAEKDRYLAITNQLFGIWESREFMEAQLWLLHRLEECTWEAFVQAHRADEGEVAFHRVGSYYDRVGTLVRRGLVDEEEILSTIGPYAIATWQKIEPLVREARRIENSVLFDDFELLIPACRACYVPAEGKLADVLPFSLAQPRHRISPSELRKLLEKGADLTLLDVRTPAQVRMHPETLPSAHWIPVPELGARFHELPATSKVIAFCACPEEVTSSRAALFLHSQGYTALALTGGYDAWRKAGLPLVELPLEGSESGETSVTSKAAPITLPINGQGDVLPAALLAAGA